MAAISHDHKFIFIHTYKAAGSSIRKALEPFEYPNLAVRKASKWIDLLLGAMGIKHPYKISQIPLALRVYPMHIQAKELKTLLPAAIYDDYFKFAFVRNPWDWQVSLYHYILETPHQFQHDLIKSFKDFDVYIRWRVEHDARLQKDFITDDEGGSIVDFVGRFENINDDFSKICKMLSITTALPHIKRSNHRDYRSYYSDESANLISQAFREDIDYFGYTFDPPSS